MTNATTTQIHNANQSPGRLARRNSDAAPMVITRLSGWIDVGEVKAEAPAWIIPTRVHPHGK